MRSIGGASALAVLSFITSSVAQIAVGTAYEQDCPYTPVWQPCKGGDPDVQCATMQVPKNWYDATEGDIVLRLIRDPVRNPDGTVKNDAFSVFYNPGGPGGSGIQSVFDSSGVDKNGVIISRTKKLTGSQFHIVSFDNRGVGLNEPYSCANPTLKRGRTGNYANSDLQSDIDYYKQKASDCNAYSIQNGDLGRRVNTPFVARDIREVSRVINSDKMIRYYGASYGTLLGDTIAKLFPQEIAKMTMDGNINPNDYYQDQLQDEEVSDVDDGFIAFFDRCADATESECAWTNPTTSTGQPRTRDSLLTKFNNWVGIDPSKDNRGRVNSPLEETRLATAADNLAESNLNSYLVRSLLKDVLNRPSLFPKTAIILQYWYDNIDQIRFLSKDGVADYAVPQPAKSNKRQIEQKSTDSGFLFDDASYDPTTAKTASKQQVNELFAITCSENTFRKANPLVKDYRDILNAYTDRSKYAGDAGTGIIFNCYPWITTSFEPALSRFENIQTSNPVLFVQTDKDPVTPYRSGLAARRAFTADSASIITSNGFGHCSGADPSATMDAAILAYWTQDILPLDGTNFTASNPNPFKAPPAKDASVDDGQTPDQVDGPGNAVDASNSQKRDLSYLFAGVSSQAKPRRRWTWPRRQANSLVIQEPCDQFNSTTSNSPTGTVSSNTTTTKGSGTTTSTGSGTTTSTGSGTTTSTGSGKITTTRYGSKTTTQNQPTGANYASTWGSWDPSKPSTTSKKPADNTWGSWDPSKPSTTAKPNGGDWNDWNDPSTGKKTTTSSWASWNADPKTTTSPVWQQWSGQSDSVPVTKTVCGKDNKDCKTTIYAVPTVTVYVDYINDVCETGITTKVITVTATCTKGCDIRPTGVPQGYTTTAVYCSACAPASTVTVTTKVSDGMQTWQAASPTAQGGQPGSKTSSVAAQASQQPWEAVSSVAAQAGKPADVQYSGSASVAAASSSWNPWNGSPTAPNVAKYTGAAVKNVASGGVFAVFAAGLLLL